MSDEQIPPGRAGVAVFICRRGVRQPLERPRHTGASVRFTTCICGAEFMAVQGQVTSCLRCKATTDDA